MKNFRIGFTFSFLIFLIVSCSTIVERPKSEGAVGISTRPLVIAHRGARSLAPENTISAARKAVELGADMWELDVAVTADQELVLLHDDTLDRTCNARDLYPGKVPWRVWDFRLEELQTLECGSWFVRTDPFAQIKAGEVTQEELDTYLQEPLPTLRQALEFTRDNHFRVNVELKDQPNPDLGKIIVEKTVALVQDLGMDDGQQVVISSFNHEYLKAILILDPKIPVQILTSQKIKNLPEYLDTIGTMSCNPKLDVWNEKDLVSLGSEGIHFNVWTVNDEASMKLLIAAKVAGIITDYPQKLIPLMNPPN